MDDVAGSEPQPEGVPLLRLRRDDAAAIVLLILDPCASPPAGIGVPRPPAGPGIVGLPAGLELALLAVEPGPVVVARPRLQGPAPVDRILELGIERPQHQVVGDVLQKVDVRSARLVCLVLVDFGCNFVGFFEREHGLSLLFKTFWPSRPLRQYIKQSWKKTGKN